MTECHHHHVRDDARDTNRLIWAFGVIVVVMVVEFVGGLMTGSLALLADATHMFADAFALGLAASAQYIARRPADRRMHFGYRRAQVLAAFMNGTILLVLLAWILAEAIQRLLEPIAVNGGPMLWIAGIGLLANGFVLFMLHSANSNNLNIRGATLHVIGDLLSSFAAVAAALMIYFFNMMIFDPLLSMLVAVLIGISAVRLLKETGHILLEGAPQQIDLELLAKGVIAAAPGVKDVHEVKIWQLTPEDARLTMHARIASSADAEKALELIKDFLEHNYGIRQSTVQIEIGEGCPDHEANAHATRAPAAARAKAEPHVHAHREAPNEPIWATGRK